jgi:hypothetical protein
MDALAASAPSDAGMQVAMHFVRGVAAGARGDASAAKSEFAHCLQVDFGCHWQALQVFELVGDRAGATEARQRVTRRYFREPAYLFIRSRADAPGAGQRITAGGAGLIGAWRVSEVAVTGPSPYTRSNPQPGIFIFTAGHYSLNMVTSEGPRSAPARDFDFNNLTEAQAQALIAEWRAFTGQAGAYEIEGNRIWFKPSVAKNENVMRGQGNVREFKVDGRTLLLITRSADQKSVQTMKLTRLD